MIVWATLIFVSLPASAAEPAIAMEPKIQTKWAKVIDTCKAAKKDAPTVHFFKQWHLSPGVNTREKPTEAPQARNLESIFLQLEQWVKNRKISAVVAEGCSGTLDSESDFKVNGWTTADLMKEKSKKAFSKIPTSVPMKIEAEFGSAIKTLCGDEAELVREQLLAFSDAIADAKYISKIAPNRKDPEKIKAYLEDVIGFLKLPKDTSVDGVIASLKEDFRKTLTRVQAAIDHRNRNLVSTIVSSQEKQIAVVYGGMHAEGVKTLLEEKGMNCRIIEPTGYQNDEAELLKQLAKAVDSI